jgi:hypothetical protein
MLKRIQFDVRIPDGISDKAILEWLRFELGANGALLDSNPLSDTELEAEFASIKIV